MKKIVGYLFICCLPLFAQHNFEFTCTSDTFQTGTDYFVYYFRLTNTGSLPDSYAFDCRVIDSIPNWFELYCAGGQCAEPGIILYDYLAPGSVDSGIDISVYPASGAWGTEKINLCVWSLNNSNLRDSINVYAAMEQGISEEHHDYGNLKELFAYPNPFRKAVNLKFQIPNTKSQTNPNFQSLNSKLKIYDATGRLVKKWDYQTKRLSDQIVWSGYDSNGHQVPPGIYFIQLEIDGKNWHTSIVKTE